MLAGAHRRIGGFEHFRSGVPAGWDRKAFSLTNPLARRVQPSGYSRRPGTSASPGG